MGKLYDKFTMAVAKSIGIFAPGTAISYVQKRAALHSYAAAAATGANKAWKPSNKSSDQHIKTDHKILRGLSSSWEVLKVKDSPLANFRGHILRGHIFRGKIIRRQSFQQNN